MTTIQQERTDIDVLIEEFTRFRNQEAKLKNNQVRVETWNEAISFLRLTSRVRSLRLREGRILLRLSASMKPHPVFRELTAEGRLEFG
jgi:hypothetical protein